MIATLKLVYLRWRVRMLVEHLQWVREQLAWGRYAEQKAEAQYRQAYADLMAAEAPRLLIPQGSTSMKRRAA